MKDIGAKFGVPGPDDMLGSTLLSWLPLSLRMREYSATIDTEKSETSKIEFKFGIGKIFITTVHSVDKNFCYL